MTEPPSAAPDPGEDPTRISRPAPGAQPPQPPRGGGGHGWQMLAVGLVALIVGAGAAWLIHGDSDNDTATTVREVRRTVTAPPPATVAVTVTQPPANTVVRTTTVPVTVTVSPAATAPTTVTAP
jgi:hypothetical protein